MGCLMSVCGQSREAVIEAFPMGVPQDKKKVPHNLAELRRRDAVTELFHAHNLPSVRIGRPSKLEQESVNQKKKVLELYSVRDGILRLKRNRSMEPLVVPAISEIKKVIDDIKTKDPASGFRDEEVMSLISSLEAV